MSRSTGRALVVFVAISIGIIAYLLTDNESTSISELPHNQVAGSQTVDPVAGESPEVGAGSQEPWEVTQPEELPELDPAPEQRPVRTSPTPPESETEAGWPVAPTGVEQSDRQPVEPVVAPPAESGRADAFEPPMRDIMEDDDLAEALLEALPEISRCQEMLLELLPEAPDPFDANIEIWVRADPDDPDFGIPEVHSISIGELVIDDVACFVEAIEEVDVPPPDESEGDLYATQVRATLSAD